jgi:hypothetical protein
MLTGELIRSAELSRKNGEIDGPDKETELVFADRLDVESAIP